VLTSFACSHAARTWPVPRPEICEIAMNAAAVPALNLGSVRYPALPITDLPFPAPSAQLKELRAYTALARRFARLNTYAAPMRPPHTERTEPAPSEPSTDRLPAVPRHHCHPPT
jgi:hypothetical protein